MSKTNKVKTDPKLAISYAFGEVGSNMSWYMVNNYLMLFYTDIVSLSAGAISLIMLIARIWDAINDPMMGNIADRTNSRWGKFRPYLLFAPPFLAIFNILTFTVWPVEGTAKVILCLISYIGLGMAYTAVNIAYAALQNVIAIDSQVRMNLATARGIGSAVIGFILSVIAAPMLLMLSSPAAKAAENPVADARGYFLFAIILSIAIMPMFWICAAGCKEKYTEELHAGDTHESPKFLDAVKLVGKNDQLLLVVIAALCGTICVTGRMGLLTYYILYVVTEMDFMQIAGVYSIMTLFQFVGVLTLPFLTSKLTKKGALIFMQTLMNVTFLLMFFFASKGMTVVLILSAIAGYCNGAANITFGLVGDSLEYGAWKTGQRMEGIAASMLSFGVKISQALCGSVGVLLLAAVGYQAMQPQTPSAKMGINVVVNLIPFVIGCLSMVPLIWYKLTPAKIDEIRADLEAGKTMADAQ